MLDLRLLSRAVPHAAAVVVSRRPAHWPRPRCESVGGEGYRCRLREHGPEVDHRCRLTIWDDESAYEPRLQVVGTPWGTYDVAALKRLAADHGEPHEVYVPLRHEPGAVDRAWARGVDLASPLVLVEGTVVDGRHRLHKAALRGQDHLPAWSLTAEQAAPALLDPERLAQIDRDDAEFRTWAAG